MDMAKSSALDEARVLSELVELFHERDVNLPTRTLYLGPDVGDLTAERFVKNLHVLAELSPDPVHVLLNNCGGDDYNCLAMCDAVLECPCEVVGVVRGSAMSAGSIVLQTCDRRVMGPLSTQMLHYGSFGFEGHALTAQSAAAEAARVNAWMEGMYLARVRERLPDFALERLREMLRFDTYLTAERSVALGLADEIG